MAAKKAQRIRLQVDGQPVKLDGTIGEYNTTTGVFRVVFDGPIDDRRFQPAVTTSNDPKYLVAQRLYGDGYAIKQEWI